MKSRTVARRALAVIALGGLIAGVASLAPVTAAPDITYKRLDKRYVNVKELNKEQAYAFVDASGPALVSGYTRGFSSVTRPEVGIYCLVPKPGARVGNAAILVTPEWGRSAGPEHNFTLMAAAGAPDCPSGNTEVITYADDPHQEAELTNLVSFMVLVPA